MSEHNPIDEVEIKFIQHEDEVDSSHQIPDNSIKTPDDENILKAGSVLPTNESSTPIKEVIINIDHDVEIEHKRDRTKDYMVYNLYGNAINPPKTTWVMYQVEPTGGSLDYSPSRNDFLILVFGIVLIMILITALGVGIVLTSDDLTDFFTKFGMILALPAMAVMIGLSYAISCSQCTRMFPCNIVILVLAVVCMTVICCYITVRYDTIVVFYAVVATAAVVLICFGLACTSFDFTSFLMYIVVIAAAFSAVFMIFMLYTMISGHYMKTVHLIMLIVSTLISVVILTMELQMVLGGRTVEIGEDDYALAAFMLYTSIVDIFIKMVQILGILDKM